MSTKAADKASPSAPLYGPTAILWSKDAYQYVAGEFHAYHEHDMNVFLHLWTTGLAIWGAIQLGLLYSETAVYVYAALITLTTPVLWTAVLHTIFVFACLQVPAASFVPSLASLAKTGGLENVAIDAMHVCALAMAVGYGLQDLAHYLCVEKTYMGSYLTTKPWMIVIHSVWLMPLVIDGVTMRYCFLPTLFVSRNRNVVTQVASREAVETLREWVNKQVPAVAETTHVWPHKQPGTAGPTVALEEDEAILAGFRKVFAAKHYDILPIQSMNEIYVTAVGAKRSINSDAVFYTPHTDGPYWWLPGASLYRELTLNIH
jgi:hypothetical protein